MQDVGGTPPSARLSLPGCRSPPCAAPGPMARRQRLILAGLGPPLDRPPGADPGLPQLFPSHPSVVSHSSADLPSLRRSRASPGDQTVSRYASRLIRTACPSSAANSAREKHRRCVCILPRTGDGQPWEADIYNPRPIYGNTQFYPANCGAQATRSGNLAVSLFATLCRPRLHAAAGLGEEIWALWCTRRMREA